MPVPADPHPPFQDYAHPERAVSAGWLSARLGTAGLKVVESDEDALLYDIGHIPTAVRIDWQRDLNDPTTRDFIDGEAFARLMDAKGIARDDTVVIYGDRSNWWAAYTLWVFELFGHEDVRLLDGGRDAWIAEERETSFLVPENPTSGYPVVERNDTEHRAFVAEVLAAAKGESIDDELATTATPSPTLLDVRDKDEYTGTAQRDYQPKSVERSGHIPGAIHRSWRGAVRVNSNFRSADQIREAFSNIDPEHPIITYCQLGDRSAHSWFVLKYLLGFKHVRNYDGSWSEWGNMVRMPIHTGDRP